MKKNGFTLVEILSVIIIIAIVSLIMVPNILGLMESLRKSSFKSTASGIIASAKMYYAEQTKVDKAEFNGKIIDFTDSDLLIDIKGKKPTAGKLVIDADGNIALYATNGEFCATKLKDTNVIEVTKGTDCIYDESAPNITLVSKDITTKSLEVKTSCNSIDGTSISKYEFNIGNGWVSKIVNGNYTDSYLFDNLISNKLYTVQTRCVNANGISLNTSSNFTTKNVPTPTINVTPTGWTMSKNVTIIYPKGQYAYYYSIDGTNWLKATTISTVDGNSMTLPTITSNRVIYAKTVDRAKNPSFSTLSITTIDTTAPSASLSLLSATTSKANVRAVCSDSESPITKYDFYLDGVFKQSYTTSNTIQEYTYSSLVYGTHTLKVVCTNAVNLTNQSSVSSTQATLVAPTIVSTPSGWATSKTVTITYPTITGETLNYYYSLDGGSSWTKETSTTKNLSFTTNGNVVAIVDDGINSLSSSYSVTGIDREAPEVPIISNPTSGIWTTEDFTLRLYSSDAGSGIGSYQYSYDNSSWNSYSNSNSNEFETPVINSQMNQKVYLRACDNLNNCSGSSSTNIKLVKNVGVDYAVYVKGSFDNWSSGSNGATVGTIGSGFLIDRFKAKLSSSNIVGGNIIYEVHVQNRGWRAGYSNDVYAPNNDINDCPNGDCTNLRIEAVKLSLSGELSTIYDVFYRVHVQEQGWLGWAKNGEITGSQALCKRVEALQIVLVKKIVSENENASSLLPSYLSGYDASKAASVTLENGATNNCVIEAVPPPATVAQCNNVCTSNTTTTIYGWKTETGSAIEDCYTRNRGSYYPDRFHCKWWGITGSNTVTTTYTCC